MKRTLTRSFLILIIVLAFLAGMTILVYRVIANASQWVQRPYNGHVAGDAGLANAGKIFDRNETVLAYSEDGKRFYHEDLDTRLALLHVVGDGSQNISTAVQSVYRMKLLNFNVIWGLGMPDTLRSGRDIQLTIDAGTCRAAYDKLDGRKGGCVVYNYKTGEILCSVSVNTYDPENPPEITPENENDDEYEGVYLDHVLSSAYTPGSIFKLVTSVAAIENISDINERTFHCEKNKRIGEGEIVCTGYHGDIDFKQALAFSCNIAFADLAVELGKENMTRAADSMGFNRSFEVDGNPTAETNYNVDDSTLFQLAWSGVGQHTNLANPMQMAILCGAIANGGVPVKPTLIKNDSWLSKAAGREDVSQYPRMLDESTANQLKDMMRYTVSEHYGDWLFEGLTVCAKTGTAEVGEDKEPNAWIVGFSLDEDAPLAFAVVVENGGYGISAAAPVAAEAMSYAAESLRSHN